MPKPYPFRQRMKRAGGRLNRLLAASLLAAPLALFHAPAPAQLPTLGDTNEMTVSAERKLGDRIAREIYRDPDYVDDAILSEYLQSIWQPLLKSSRARGELTPELDERYAWEVMLIRDRTVNAFALPGGYLGVHLGLIGTVSSKDELASVLAHELSHVTQRHIARMMTQQGKQSPFIIGAMILGILAAGKSADVANATVVGSQAFAMQSQLNFSRDMEREADRIGYSLMAPAGFQTMGFVTMFEKLQQASRLNDNGSFPYLRSHPMTSERISDMQLRQQLEGRPAATQPQLMEHSMLSARARLMANPAVDLLRSAVTQAQHLGTSPVNTARQAGDLYGAAFAASRLRDFAKARELQQRLAALVAGDAAALRQARLLDVEIDIAAGEPAKGLAKIDASMNSRPEVFLAAQANSLLGSSAQMVSPLQTWIAVHPHDAAGWQWLAGAYTAAGQPLRALRAEAEVQVERLDYAAAVDRFKAAQDMIRRGDAGRGAQDYMDASIIDTRLRQVDSLLREQRLER